MSAEPIGPGDLVECIEVGAGFVRGNIYTVDWVMPIRFSPMSTREGLRR